MQYIYANAYDSLCQYEFPTQKKIVPGLWYCNTEHIAEFFNHVEGSDAEITLVSSYSDYGVSYQSDKPPYNDFEKALAFIDKRSLGYNSVRLQPRCKLENCIESDPYSIRCYAYTHSTFPKIPTNITKWYTTNCDIAEATPIPFGLYPGGEYNFEKLSNIEKEDTVYINFQNYTKDRAELKLKFRKYKNIPHINFVWDASLPREEFLDAIAKSKFVVCPEGNGLDSHRIWEVLYSGSIPVLLYDNWSYRLLEGLPVIFVHYWEQVLNIQWLVEQSKQLDFSQIHKLDLDYWNREFQQYVRGD